MLRTALGPSIAAYLEDPSIVEVMLNPDGRLWIDRLSGGLEDTGCRVTPADAERIVRLTGSTSSITYQPLPTDDPKQRRPDITRAWQRLGRKPVVDLETGLTQTIEWFKSRV